MDGEEKQILRFFNLEDAPEPLRSLMRSFGDLARQIIFEIHDSEFRDLALYELLQSRDATIRAKILQIEGATAKD
jgi:hypothetical protein